MLAGRWNSPRVVTTLAPASRSRHTSSKSIPRMYRTQSAPSATMSSIAFVAITPFGSTPQSSPASVPDLVVRVDVQTDQLEIRVVDHRPQRLHADVPGRPLDDGARRVALRRRPA